jgi:hypothetical protein
LVSLVRALIVVFALLTLVSATAGLWVYNSHISPLKALASKPSIADVLDLVESMRYTMEFDGEVWIVNIYNDPGRRSGVIEVYSAGYGQPIAVYEYNYTRTTLTWLTVTREGNRTLLNPLDYNEAFATNLKFTQAEDGTVKSVEPFPGIAPLYALTYIGNATLVDWSTFYSIRRDRSPPQWVHIAFAKVRVEGGEARGVEVVIEPQPTPLTAYFKWYNVGVHAKVAAMSRIAVAWELTLTITKPTGEQLEVRIKLENLKLRT